MRDAVLAAAIVLVSYGLMIGGRSWRDISGIAVLVAALVLLVAAIAPPLSVAPRACWVLVIVIALVVAWGRAVPGWMNWSLAVAAGLAAGVALSGTPVPMRLATLTGLSMAFPAHLAITRGLAVAPRVVAGWLAAVALLALVLPLVVAHPGYVADHRG